MKKIFQNQDYSVFCVFQIWERKGFPREIVSKLEPKCFKFVQKNQDPDIAFRRVGVYAGKIDLEIISKNTQSHYFIKFTNGRSQDNLKELKLIQFETNNIVGPRSISKQEMIDQFNRVLSISP